MRKLVYAAITTLDGFENNTFFGRVEDTHAVFNRQFEAADAIIFDQENHELLVPYWDDLDLNTPDIVPVEREFAELFRAKPRYVFDSRRELEPLASALTGPAHERVAELKAQPGSQLLLATGPALFQTCLEHNLVDEIEVLINPLIVGTGTPALGVSTAAHPLRLLETYALEGGPIVARYAVT